MRNMSFFLTTNAVKNRTKDVTRRLGWKFLKPGDRFRAVRKAMGLKKGEHIEVLAICECVINTPMRLYSISQEDVRREGFTDKDADQFVEMFCAHMDCDRDQIVNRIEFKYVEAENDGA